MCNCMKMYNPLMCNTTEFKAHWQRLPDTMAMHHDSKRTLIGPSQLHHAPSLSEQFMSVDNQAPPITSVLACMITGCKNDRADYVALKVPGCCWQLRYYVSGYCQRLRAAAMLSPASLYRWMSLMRAPCFPYRLLDSLT
eukprot:GHUV01026827.1.p1 GENE.GHUV01026827.1~~GHUV01026827.1.p1  ORF type:complete len:139 (-),score=12.03 GHUV01026827.1:440-856(-)